MYEQRLKIFIILCTIPFAAAIARLAQIQLVFDSGYRAKVNDLASNRSKVLKTLRGRILDRNGTVVAGNEVKFSLCISYNLTRFADERFWQGELVKSLDRSKDMQALLKELHYDRKRAALQDVINRCTALYGKDAAEIQAAIASINDSVWKQRSFQAWYRNCLSSQLRMDYGSGRARVDFREAMADFETQYPDAMRRLGMIAKVTDLDTMRQKWPLVELAGDQDIFATQMQFPDINDMEVVPLEVRTYPFTSVASQTVGWVGLVQERDSKLYADDPRARYTDKELCGHSGIEYVCEPLLRGRRGEETYTYDRTEVVGRTETQPGRDIRLTLDFDLQSKVEAMLDKGMAPTAAVIIDTASSDILALVSLPRFDLTELRQKYNEYLKQENNPLINRALDSTYPPGSVIKPIILIAAMEEHAIRSEDCISCPSHMVAAPNCWRMLEFGVGHDSQWPNNARNALKGSCNVYFSRLAERLSSEQIQKWLGKFGYGTDVLQDTCALPDANEAGSVRGFEQMAGTIYTGVAGQGTGAKVIADGERRFFGIGQGSLRVTPLQVANAMAAIARGGIYRAPHLILKAQNDAYDAQSLDISPHTLTVIRDGMHAVTSESGGTAYKVFGSARFGAAGVTVYGKTGSTQAPEHAWFAGFAQDDRGRSVAFSVIVEGGKHGADDAAPLAKRIVQYCIDAGYIGPNNPQVPVVR